MITVGSLMDVQSVALDAGRVKVILASTYIHAAVKEHFKDVGDGHKCQLCGEIVGHPRAAAAHMAVHHPKELQAAMEVEARDSSEGRKKALAKTGAGVSFYAIGTSEGAIKGWDIRGRVGKQLHQGVNKAIGLAKKIGPQASKSLGLLTRMRDEARSSGKYTPQHVATMVNMVYHHSGVSGVKGSLHEGLSNALFRGTQSASSKGAKVPKEDRQTWNWA